MGTIWRLTSPAFARILNGEGNRIFGARWNSPGRGVVYTCAHLSLCVLETYVNMPLDVEPQQVVLGEAESADGRFGFQATMWPVPIVAMQPDG